MYPIVAAFGLNVVANTLLLLVDDDEVLVVITAGGEVQPLQVRIADRLVATRRYTVFILEQEQQDGTVLQTKQTFECLAEKL